jgi:hypothetical protein
MKIEDLENCITAAQVRYYRLVLLVGPAGSGKTQVLLRLAKDARFPYINLGLALSQRLLEYPARTRSLRVPQIVAVLLDEAGADTVLLDNTEILSEPTLKQDPLRLLQQVSRNPTVVASWNGRFEDRVLTYAHPDHPEFKKYYDVDALICPVS